VSGWNAGSKNPIGHGHGRNGGEKLEATSYKDSVTEICFEGENKIEHQSYLPLMFSVSV
jgi:hypothetical protein